MSPKWRTERFHKEFGRNISVRTDFQRDRDRILHCSAFRRLATITQTVSPNQGHVLHNRLTHALKVAQIGRRLTERLLHFPGQRRKADELGGINPDVVEAAGLAHDLGHPPFGHAAEKALQKVSGEGLPDSFEGNAQSLRIVADLAIRDDQYSGLNLTRATLNAILKYPWSYDADDPTKKNKWGVYNTEAKLFEWARKPLGANFGPEAVERQTLEASIMDFSDDIAYSVYDLEDFTKAGKIPLDRLLEGPSSIFSYDAGLLFERLSEFQADLKYPLDEYKKALIRIKTALPALPKYTGIVAERARFRDLTSTLVGRFMNSVKIGFPKSSEDSYLNVPHEIRMEVELLKKLTFCYVIFDSSLANQQSGYTRIIKDIYFKFIRDVRKKDYRGFPYASQESFKERKSKVSEARLVMDFVASLTEHEAVGLHQRIRGINDGALFVSPF